MKKFLLSIATFVTMAVLCVVSAGAESYNGFEYSVLTDGTVSITSYTGGNSVVEIPSVIDGKTVTVIADKAFYGQRSLASVTMPDTITTLGNEVFNCCESLETVSLSDALTSIGEKAFYECISLKSIYIPYNVKTIGDYAFYFCERLSSATLPDSLTSIGAYTFYECAALGYIRIPNNVTSIGNYAFYNCDAMDYAILSEKLTSIGDNAFYGCSYLDEMEIPATVESIGKYAFAMCSLLDTVTLEDGIASVGEGAFYMCPKLTTITVPASVTSIGNYAFGYYFDFDTYAPTAYDNVIIYCQNGSAAHTYAVQSGVQYRFVTGGDTPVLDVIASVSTKGSKYITLTWNSLSSATGYVIEQFNGTNWVQVAKIEDNATTSYKITDLTPGTGYKFRMYAYSGTTKGDYTSTLTVNTLMTNVDGFTSPSKSTTAIRLSWTKNDYAAGYIIEQYKNNTWVQLADITDSETVTYKVTGLSSGTAYKFRMRAYSITKYGETVNGYDTGTLILNTQATAVKGLALKSRSSTALRLTWNKNKTVSGYEIEQYQDGKWVQIADITDNTVTEYKVTGLKSGTTYKFRMRAYNVTSYGTKAYSVYTSSLKQATAPSAVSKLVVRSRAKTAIRLAWKQNTSAKGYIIEQYKNGEWVRVGKVTPNDVTNYRIDGLESGTTYQFRVKTYIFTDTAIFSNYTYIDGTTL
ncbi:MAG: leucine-rich repeat protein [Ruminiclostridium sp.]|nr:leucine-rich repeat protein [Ruminiclostridium sp.]